MDAKKQEEDLCEKQKQEEALTSNDRALALETQSNALWIIWSKADEKLKIAKDVGEGKREKRRDGKTTDGAERKIVDATVLDHVSRQRRHHPLQQRRSAYRLGSKKTNHCILGENETHSRIRR